MKIILRDAERRVPIGEEPLDSTTWRMTERGLENTDTITVDITMHGKVDHIASVVNDRGLTVASALLEIANPIAEAGTSFALGAGQIIVFGAT